MSQNKAVEVFQGEDGQWYFKIKARNGEIVSSSEGYTVAASAYRGAEAVENALNGKQHDGVRQIAAERTRQQLELGYDKEHDAGQSDLIMDAAACYIMASIGPTSMVSDVAEYWPWGKANWKPKSRKENLIRAGALIAAAIDALDEEEDAI